MKKNKTLLKLVGQLLAICFRDGKVIESKVIKSIKILKSLPRSESIYALSEFLKSLKRIERRYTLMIETSSGISHYQIQRIKKSIGKKTTKVIVKINPEILGGVRLRLGDDVWDSSVLGNINQVKEAIVHGGSGE